MLIDWFTVIAQVVNFLILVWLMKRFLYAPILDAIDAREQRIATSLADALAKQGEAQRQQDEYREKNEKFERQCMDLLRSAELEAREERHRLFEEARKAHEELCSRQQEALHIDFQNLKDEIRRRARQEVFAITRKTLADLAAESLEERMVEAFIRHCLILGEEERRGLRAAFVTPAGPAWVHSTFPLPVALQQDLETAIRETFTYTGQLRFETSPDLVSGIALSMNGHEIAWSIADYLQTLEENVAEVLNVRPPGKELETNFDEAKPEGFSNPQPDRGEEGHG